MSGSNEPTKPTKPTLTREAVKALAHDPIGKIEIPDKEDHRSEKEKAQDDRYNQEYARLCALGLADPSDSSNFLINQRFENYPDVAAGVAEKTMWHFLDGQGVNRDSTDLETPADADFSEFCGSMKFTEFRNTVQKCASFDNFKRPGAAVVQCFHAAGDILPALGCKSTVLDQIKRVLTLDDKGFAVGTQMWNVMHVFNNGPHRATQPWEKVVSDSEGEGGAESAKTVQQGAGCVEMFRILGWGKKAGAREPLAGHIRKQVGPLCDAYEEKEAAKRAQGLVGQEASPLIAAGLDLIAEHLTECAVPYHNEDGSPGRWSRRGVVRFTQLAFEALGAALMRMVGQLDECDFQWQSKCAKSTAVEGGATLGGVFPAFASLLTLLAPAKFAMEEQIKKFGEAHPEVDLERLKPLIWGLLLRYLGACGFYQAKLAVGNDQLFRLMCTFLPDLTAYKTSQDEVRANESKDVTKVRAHREEMMRLIGCSERAVQNVFKGLAPTMNAVAAAACAATTAEAFHLRVCADSESPAVRELQSFQDSLTVLLGRDVTPAKLEATLHAAIRKMTPLALTTSNKGLLNLWAGLIASFAQCTKADSFIEALDFEPFGRDSLEQREAAKKKEEEEKEEEAAPGQATTMQLLNAELPTLKLLEDEIEALRLLLGFCSTAHGAQMLTNGPMCRSAYDHNLEKVKAVVHRELTLHAELIARKQVSSMLSDLDVISLVETRLTNDKDGPVQWLSSLLRAGSRMMCIPELERDMLSPAQIRLVLSDPALHVQKARALVAGGYQVGRKYETLSFAVERAKALEDDAALKEQAMRDQEARRKRCRPEDKSTGAKKKKEAPDDVGPIHSFETNYCMLLVAAATHHAIPVEVQPEVCVFKAALAPLNQRMASAPQGSALGFQRYRGAQEENFDMCSIKWSAQGTTQASEGTWMLQHDADTRKSGQVWLPALSSEHGTETPRRYLMSNASTIQVAQGTPHTFVPGNRHPTKEANVQGIMESTCHTVAVIMAHGTPPEEKEGAAPLGRGERCAYEAVRTVTGPTAPLLCGTLLHLEARLAHHWQVHQHNGEALAAEAHYKSAHKWSPAAGDITFTREPVTNYGVCEAGQKPQLYEENENGSILLFDLTKTSLFNGEREFPGVSKLLSVVTGQGRGLGALLDCCSAECYSSKPTPGADELEAFYTSLAPLIPTEPAKVPSSKEALAKLAQSETDSAKQIPVLVETFALCQAKRVSREEREEFVESVKDVMLLALSHTCVEVAAVVGGSAELHPMPAEELLDRPEIMSCMFRAVLDRRPDLNDMLFVNLGPEEAEAHQFRPEDEALARAAFVVGAYHREGKKTDEEVQGLRGPRAVNVADPLARIVQGEEASNRFLEARRVYHALFSASSFTNHAVRLAKVYSKIAYDRGMAGLNEKEAAAKLKGLMATVANLEEALIKQLKGEGYHEHMGAEVLAVFNEVVSTRDDLAASLGPNYWDFRDDPATASNQEAVLGFTLTNTLKLIEVAVAVVQAKVDQAQQCAELSAIAGSAPGGASPAPSDAGEGGSLHTAMDMDDEDEDGSDSDEPLSKRVRLAEKQHGRDDPAWLGAIPQSLPVATQKEKSDKEVRKALLEVEHGVVTERLRGCAINNSLDPEQRHDDKPELALVRELSAQMSAGDLSARNEQRDSELFTHIAEALETRRVEITLGKEKTAKARVRTLQSILANAFLYAVMCDSSGDPVLLGHISALLDVKSDIVLLKQTRNENPDQRLQTCNLLAALHRAPPVVADADPDRDPSSDSVRLYPDMPKKDQRGIVKKLQDLKLERQKKLEESTAARDANPMGTRAGLQKRMMKAGSCPITEGCQPLVVLKEDAEEIKTALETHCARNPFVVPQLACLANVGGVVDRATQARFTDSYETRWEGMRTTCVKAKHVPKALQREYTKAAEDFRDAMCAFQASEGEARNLVHEMQQELAEYRRRVEEGPQQALEGGMEIDD